MKIALDYDDTYTRDPILWHFFVEAAQERGHDVYCVTARKDTQLDDIEFTLGRILLPNHIIATGHAPKRRFTQDMGIMFDVWIDDSPEFIVDMPLLGKDK